MGRDKRPASGTLAAQVVKRKPWVPSRKPNGFVYFVRTCDCQFVKIGWSFRRPDDRLEAIQSGNHLELERAGIMRCYQDMEGRIHKRFERYRIRNEWFHLSPSLAAFIRQHASPWELIPRKERGVKTPDIAPDEAFYPAKQPRRKRGKVERATWKPENHHKNHIERMAKIYEAAGVEYIPPKWGQKRQ